MQVLCKLCVRLLNKLENIIQCSKILIKIQLKDTHNHAPTSGVSQTTFLYVCAITSLSAL